MKGKSPQQTKEELGKHYGESTSSVETVYKQFQNFERSHMNTRDAQCFGSPAEATTPKSLLTFLT